MASEPMTKPCPFCGGAPVIERRPLQLAKWVVLCPTCGCTRPGCITEESAIARWNRRHATTAPAPAILFGHDGTTGGNDDPNG